ncbi:MAG: CHAT domain-containing protein [Oscillatoria sp. SIO1A7]|nr:CHAT domain-containing protein [Oscillatoria sp. SIO1A7]
MKNIEYWLRLAIAALLLASGLGAGKAQGHLSVGLARDGAVGWQELPGKNVAYRLEDLGEDAGEPLLQSQAMEQRARMLYEKGRFLEAVALLEQMEADYAGAGDGVGRATALRNLSLAYQAIGERGKANAAIANSLEIIQGLEKTTELTKLLALVLESQGQLELSSGQSAEALDTWKEAARLYKEIEDVAGLTRSQINQTQALEALGLYRQALKTLKELNETLQGQPDSLVKAKGLQSLGDALRLVGDLKQSREVLQDSLTVAQRLEAVEAIAATLLSLGNTSRLQRSSEEALDFYQRAAAQSILASTRIEAELNQASLLIEEEEWSGARALVDRLQSNLQQNTIGGRVGIYARINLARSLMKIELSGIKEKENSKQLKSALINQAAGLLADAVRESERIGDTRAGAYALGSLGGLYEQIEQWSDARQATDRALLLAQSINAADIAYQWQWQLGRILKVQGDRDSAISAYTQAVNTLQSLRGDLVAISSEVQFSFRESVEPVYRELVGILLEPGDAVEQSALVQARDTIESLQLAELDNFFRDACLDAEPAQVDRVDPNAAVFYPIILRDRLEVILAMPGQPLRHYSTNLPQEEVEATLKKMRDALTIPRLQLSVKNFWRPSQKAYDWLIRPVEKELADSGVETLVFVPDGALRNVPLIALYDGEQYLVQKYGVAITPGLQLLDPKPLAREQLQILAAGLTEARQDFSPLPGVQFELEKIGSEVPTEVLLNQSFTESSFKSIVNSFPFPVVHLATHGEFSSNAEETFILTWDEKINANELDNLLRTDKRQTRPIELLVLSACKTAAGDSRAALGLAGVAVRAGARSTVASLWYVNDAATSLLMTEFYKELAENSQLTKAEALRRAQQHILENHNFSHPYFWSAFVLVGNWL